VPLLYTRPIVTIGMELRASTDNIALRQEVADRIRAQAPDNAAQIEAQNRLMRERLGQYVMPDPRPFEIERHDAVLPSPRRVAVLIDGAASTGEQFLLLARQSRKGTLFGQRNSAGVLDFANVVGVPTPSGRYRLQWATSRSLRLPQDPVDPDGIPPDIRIPEGERDPVRYAAAWLERQVD
jgi:C-terminal processing protease CtpA/Prc